MGTANEAEYKEYPGISPYREMSAERYENPKETFKFAASKVVEKRGSGGVLSLVDVGCANGEFLYYFKGLVPRWSLYGRDFTPEYIEAARGFPGLNGVDFQVEDLFDMDSSFDVVTMLGTFQVFPEFEAPLAKLLQICKPGGLVIVDGLFNKHDVDVRVTFRDDSVPETRGVWQQDFTQHSRTGLATFLVDQGYSVSFEDVPMGVEIPRDPARAAASAFTFRDAHGNNIITNGLNMIVDPTLMIIENSK